MTITIGNPTAPALDTAGISAKRYIAPRMMEAIVEVKVLIKSRRQKKRKNI